MNEFIKAWITSTCAPESIINIKDIDGNRLDVISNEKKTLKVFVLSTENKVLAIGRNYNELLDSKEMSIMDAVRKVSELLSLNRILQEN